jgi:small multidrug resistance pump
VNYAFLFAAILLEVMATSVMKASEGFTKFWPSVITICGYLASFYCLSQTLCTIPVGIAYATWSGVGIVLIAAIGWIWHKQALDLPALLGMGMIIVGVLVIHVFSESLPR